MASGASAAAEALSGCCEAAALSGCSGAAGGVSSSVEPSAGPETQSRMLWSIRAIVEGSAVLALPAGAPVLLISTPVPLTIRPHELGMALLLCGTRA